MRKYFIAFTGVDANGETVLSNIQSKVNKGGLSSFKDIFKIQQDIEKTTGYKSVVVVFWKKYEREKK